MALGGVAIVVPQRDWMCDEGGFEGWNGKWRNSALLLDLSFVFSTRVIVFSYATRSLTLVLAFVGG